MHDQPTSPQHDSESMTGGMILLLDPNARAGRTGYRLKVKDAKRQAQTARGALGNSHSDTPTTVEILRAAKCLSTLLFDATEGDAKITIELDGQHIAPALVLSTLLAG